MTFKPSDEHARAVAEGARHHARSKTYSGRLMGSHFTALTEIVARIPCESALDYGCGKGEQYAHPTSDGKTIEDRWGFEVAKFDPCWPPFAREPEGKFDLVICTHVLFAIPRRDLEAVVERLFALAGRAVYIAEQIGPRKKNEIADPENRAIGWSSEQWQDFIGPIADRYPEIETNLTTRLRSESGTHYTERRRLAGTWQIVDEWQPRESG